jgi:hypothetical protein
VWKNGERLNGEICATLFVVILILFPVGRKAAEPIKMMEINPNPASRKTLEIDTGCGLSLRWLGAYSSNGVLKDCYKKFEVSFPYLQSPAAFPDEKNWHDLYHLFRCKSSWWGAWQEEKYGK